MYGRALLEGNAAAVRLHDLAHDRKPEAGAVRRERSGRLTPSIGASTGANVGLKTQSPGFPRHPPKNCALPVRSGEGCGACHVQIQDVASLPNTSAAERNRQ